ncbi:MAG: type II toxin-antitoxin system VapC family toxin [Chloroflexota bacterium]|nr:type II toxin-antitoxin system VapC family toxin [Chloroflexota bacterium]
MSRIAVDASIAVNWVLDDELDPRGAAALDQLRRDGAVVPQHWHYEVRNVLLIAERRRRIPQDGIEERLDLLRALPILTDQEARLPEALELARTHRLSFYDALYLELATRRGAPLATLDRALDRAAVAEGVDIANA